MAYTSFPFDNADSTEPQYTRLMNEAVDMGIADAQGSTTFQVTAGAGMTVNILAGPNSNGLAIVRGHAINITATEPKTVAAAHASLSRWDRIVLRLSESGNAITPEYLQGTAGSSSPPTPTQTLVDNYEMPLARFLVPAGASAASSFTFVDERQFIGATGGTWFDDNSRPGAAPGLSAPRKGKFGYNVARGYWEFWNGTAWSPMAPSTVDNAVKWNGLSIILSASQPSVAPNTIWGQLL